MPKDTKGESPVYVLLAATDIPETSLAAIALFEQAASIETADFDVYASPAVFEKVFKP